MQRDSADYCGEATLEFEHATIRVDIELRGHPQPIDGIYRWYGRAKRNEELSTFLAGSRSPAIVRTPTGAAAAQIGEPDVWDRYRILGKSRPPYDPPTIGADV